MAFKLSAAVTLLVVVVLILVPEPQLADGFKDGGGHLRTEEAG